MAKKPTKRAAPVLAAITEAQDNSVLIASRNAVRSERSLAETIKVMMDAGIDKAIHQPVLRLGYIAKYTAWRLNPDVDTLSNEMLAHARATLALAGAGTKQNDRRTQAEEDIYTASRQAWGRLLTACGVKTVATRGTKSAASKKAKAAKAGKLVVPPAHSVGEAYQHVAAQGAGLLAYVNKAQTGPCKGKLHKLVELTNAYKLATAKLLAEYKAEAEA